MCIGNLFDIVSGQSPVGLRKVARIEEKRREKKRKEKKREDLSANPIKKFKATFVSLFICVHRGSASGVSPIA